MLWENRGQVTVIRSTCREFSQREGNISPLCCLFVFLFFSLTGSCTKSEWTANHHHHPHSGCSGWRWLGSNVSSLCPGAKHTWLPSAHLSSCHTWAENSGKYTIFFSSSLSPLWPQWDSDQVFSDIKWG